ncbi:hypothetical protein AGLY_004072 [Aphis glycines]|uniref:Uncharacterized protein n=1 Tax=Aphis glycines TaxID=307491 RepID=A0A6G0TZH2_APHGL|nr:hypothetical protein AGLY_004072 [Aphis glycines]
MPMRISNEFLTFNVLPHPLGPTNKTVCNTITCFGIKMRSPFSKIKILVSSIMELIFSIQWLPIGPSTERFSKQQSRLAGDCFLTCYVLLHLLKLHVLFQAELYQEINYLSYSQIMVRLKQNKPHYLREYKTNILLPSVLASLNPSLKRIVSAICLLSGTNIDTDRNIDLKLSGLSEQRYLCFRCLDCNNARMLQYTIVLAIPISICHEFLGMKNQVLIKYVIKTHGKHYKLEKQTFKPLKNKNYDLLSHILIKITLLSFKLTKLTIRFLLRFCFSQFQNLQSHLSSDLPSYMWLLTFFSVSILLYSVMVVMQTPEYLIIKYVRNELINSHLSNYDMENRKSILLTSSFPIITLRVSSLILFEVSSNFPTIVGICVFSLLVVFRNHIIESVRALGMQKVALRLCTNAECGHAVTIVNNSSGKKTESEINFNVEIDKTTNIFSTNLDGKGQSCVFSIYRLPTNNINAQLCIIIIIFLFIVIGPDDNNKLGKIVKQKCLVFRMNDRKSIQVPKVAAKYTLIIHLYGLHIIILWSTADLFFDMMNTNK